MEAPSRVPTSRHWLIQEGNRDPTTLTLALAGEIYFNLHTTAQTYYGDLRGQIYPSANTAH